MANILEYTLSLQDRMSSRLRQVGINSDAALNRFVALERRSREVSQALRDSGNAVGALKQKLDLLRSEREWIPERNISTIQRYNREIQGLERQITRLESHTGGNMVGRWFKDAFNQVPFAGLLTNPLVIAGAIGGAAIKKGIQSDMQNTSFEVLLGSEDAAKKMVADITKYGMETPYDKMGLGEAAKMMLGFGIAQDKIMPNMRAIGDIAMGDANKMNSLTLAFSQMSSAGKLNGQDLLQMINAGFNPLGIISKKTGKSMAYLKDEMSKGKISSQMVTDAFMSATSAGGQFNNMAVLMGQTTGGKAAQLLDKFTEKLLKIYEYISPIVNVLIDLGGAALDAVSNGIGWLIQKFSEGGPVITGIVIALGALTASLIIMKAISMAQAAWTGIVTVANMLQTASWWSLNAAMLANPMTWIIAGVIALIALIGFLVYKVDGWGEAWHHTIEGIKSIFGAAMSYLKFGWLAWQHVILSGIDLIKIAWFKLKSLWDKDGATVELAKIKQASDNRLEAVKSEGKAIIDQGKAGIDHFKKAGGSLKFNDKSLGDFKNDMLGAMGMGGISDPKGTPGAGKVTTGLGESDSNLEKSNTAIATGGSKTNYITINLQEMIGIKANTVNGSKEEIENIGTQATDQLLRTLAMADTAGS
ncbi:hypothetical protein Q765_00210 [Flavobacterium rivuli WB 3.3-2 = DSM 21788]|uniref:Tape measure protein N-terminal domain-containing protein n=1 Tax=Flavobacterium rivuli WB 3.3-2 = DSM 21788 TaxID=1121895 RepID=A0A0A2M7X3_9FLAO|nr:tape measure protein [Flavobacterium rivuli]KGO88379.1 hypothetical protein Q765_00210 [Flavobacterium rivuli WB 3.3-2 = DSM 21788]